MTTDNLRTLIQYRLAQADEALDAAQILLHQHSLRAVVNRAYYAMFYAVLALLALRKQETSKHAGAISLFDREFVRPGIFSRDLSQGLHRAFRRRLTADYAVPSPIQQEEAQQVYDEAKIFVAQVTLYLQQELAR